MNVSVKVRFCPYPITFSLCNFFFFGYGKNSLNYIERETWGGYFVCYLLYQSVDYYREIIF